MILVWRLAPISCCMHLPPLRFKDAVPSGQMGSDPCNLGEEVPSKALVLISASSMTLLRLLRITHQRAFPRGPKHHP